MNGHQAAHGAALETPGRAVRPPAGGAPWTPGVLASRIDRRDGDFRSLECVERLKQADIVVTNPPFSLFREYVSQLMEHDKQFLIIGSMNAATC